MIVSDTYNMDSLQGMKDYPNKYFDLAIVDPPYGIDAPNFQMGANKKKINQILVIVFLINYEKHTFQKVLVS